MGMSEHWRIERTTDVCWRLVSSQSDCKESINSFIRKEDAIDNKRKQEANKGTEGAGTKSKEQDEQREFDYHSSGMIKMLQRSRSRIFSTTEAAQMRRTNNKRRKKFGRKISTDDDAN